MLYLAIETTRPTLALVCEAIKAHADNFEELARDADIEESKRPDPTRIKLGTEGLYIKGERQLKWRSDADALREFLVQLLS